MAAASRRQDSSLTDQLHREPYRFEFFQAVRLLGRIASQQPAERAAQPVGEDHAPQDELVRFRVLPSHTFPAASIYSFQEQAAFPEGYRTPPEMVVAFHGLIGPTGVLPRHYTQLVIDRLRQKDTAIRDFLDLFQHRQISLFYRAWEKYRFPIGYERWATHPHGAEQDLFTRCLYSLVGWGTKGLLGRLEVADETTLYYSGLFAHFPRNAISLERMVADYFELAAEVLQFVGQWLYLAEEDQTRMPSLQQREGQNNRLGYGALVGERVWGVENKFRVRLGPLTHPHFRRFMPDADQLVLLCQLVRSYVGPDFDFDVQLLLWKAEVPPCVLKAEGPDGSRLGWDAWMHNQPPQKDAGDAIFAFEGNPLR